MAELGRICRLQAGGDLGQPRMPCDERRAAGRRRLRRDHAECLGEDRRHDACVGEREQMPEVSMLERPGEEGRDTARRRHAPPAPRARARSRRRRDRHPYRPARRSGPGHPSARSACRSRRRRLARGEGRPRAGWRCPRPGVAPRRSRDSADRRRASSSRPASAASRGCGTHSSMSTPGGTSITFSVWPHTSASTVRMWSEPTNVARAPRERVCAPGREARIAAHRVLELGAVCLDGERRAGSGPDRPAEEHVVREDEVSREERPDARRRSPRPSRRALPACSPGRVARRSRRSGRGRRPAAGPPTSGRSDARRAEVVALGMRLLREDGHVVPCPAPLAGEHPGVDVRARAAEQVAVPEEDAHRCILPQGAMARRQRCVDCPRPSLRP